MPPTTATTQQFFFVYFSLAGGTPCLTRRFSKGTCNGPGGTGRERDNVKDHYLYAVTLCKGAVTRGSRAGVETSAPVCGCRRACGGQGWRSTTG
jgi:hypothetical protein